MSNIQNSPSIKKKITKPCHQPDAKSRNIVAHASGIGLPHEQIAILVGIDDTTLRKYYRKELDEGKAKAHQGIATTLYDKAMSGDTSAMIWWSKTQLKWSETVKTELEANINGNLTLNVIGVAPKDSIE
jgi:hypothetical protein